MSRRARILAAILTAAAVVAAPAIGAKPKAGAWKATKVQLGYDLEFKVAKGKVSKVVGHVLERCTGDDTSNTVTFAPSGKFKVKGNGRFAGKRKTSSGGVTVIETFSGRFVKAGKAKGILRMESIVAGSRCDTYELEWTAKPG